MLLHFILCIFRVRISGINGNAGFSAPQCYSQLIAGGEGSRIIDYMPISILDYRVAAVKC